MNVLENGPNFRSLSLRDLLEARDLYHFHLMNKANVVGTAIGLYLIRDDDKTSGPRTLANSRVVAKSWPCVMVFVRKWLDERDFGFDKKAKASEMVPKTLFMPDGRAVPVCVVYVEEADPVEHRSNPLPHSGLGAGLPLEVEAQNALHTASAGCLVTNGNMTYALTARHVCGAPGTEVFVRTRGEQIRIGTSSDKQLTRVPFSEAYQDFPCRQSYLTMDVGLVALDDVTQWTSNVYGLPPTGPLADVYSQNLTLQLIDQPVVAHGAASGLLRGTIKGLFYRYRSVGGYDYIGDLLIAPIPESRSPVHGDSGTVWHLDVTEARDSFKKRLEDLDLRPLAVLWGGQTFDVGGTRSNFTIATTLSNVCRMLDVELVTNRNRGVSGYWGRMGHYSIAAYAVQMVRNKKLRKLLENNLDRLSFDIQTLTEMTSKEILAGADFIPLADVADEIWKKYKTNPGGRDIRSSGKGRTTGPEHPNHYADIDFPYKNKKSLRELCLSSPDTYFTPKAFADYYEWLSGTHPEFGGTKNDPFKQGLLPFRVWQFFNTMKSAAATDIVEFVAAAGLVAHYMGDACQPLHGSVFADGDPSRTKTIVHPKSGQEETVSYGAGIHSAFETAMIDRHRESLFAQIDTLVPLAKASPLGIYKTGKQAGLATVQLMDEAHRLIKPMDICDAFEELGGTPSPRVAVLDGLYDRFGEATAQAMARGAQHLACLWDSAWEAGGGNAGGLALDPIDKDELRTKYEDTGFVPSLTLGQIGKILK